MSVFDEHKEGGASRPVASDRSFKQLIAENDYERAYPLAKKKLLQGDFSEIGAENIYPFVRVAYQNNEPEDVINIVNHFYKQFPTNEAMVDACILAAKVMNENYHEKDNAIAMLDRLRGHFDSSSDLAKIDKVQQSIKED